MHRMNESIKQIEDEGFYNHAGVLYSFNPWFQLKESIQKLRELNKCLSEEIHQIQKENFDLINENLELTAISETPFNPELLGFVAVDNRKWHIENKSQRLFWNLEQRTHIEDSEKGTDFYLINKRVADSSEWSVYRGLIPNHAFGVALLKNLGVIE